MRLPIKYFSISIVALAFLAGCGRSPEELAGSMILTENIEEFVHRADEASELGKKAIPIYLAVLNRFVENIASPLEIDKSYWCIFHLKELAGKGVSSLDEIPILLRHLETWPVSYKSTLLAADTLKITE